MYIIDDKSKKKINFITIILDKNEMQQLLGYAKQLLEKEPPSDHYHLSSEDYEKEITICLCERIEELHPRIQSIIKDNKNIGV